MNVDMFFGLAFLALSILTQVTTLRHDDWLVSFLVSGTFLISGIMLGLGLATSMVR